MGSKRSLVITTIVGVAVVVGFLALRGYRVPSEGTEGAIGAANRYESGQIEAKDVQLQDAEIQAFIQSDTFHKIATNPEFRKLVTELSFREAAGMEAYQSLMENKVQAQSLANKEFVAWLVDPSTLELVRSEAYTQMSAECNMSELLFSPRTYAIMLNALENKASATEFREMVLKSRELPQSFVEFASREPAVVIAALQPRLLQAKEMILQQNGAAELLANPRLAILLENKAFTNVVSLQAHEELMQTPELMNLAFSSEVFNKICEAQQWEALERGFAEIRTQ